jgi:hypothetical protein
MPRDLGLVWQDLRAVAAWNVRRRSLVELPGAVSHAGPDDVLLISDDLPRFLAALDAGGRARDFERLYFAPASAGLREFRHRRAAEFSGLAGRVARRRGFYASARRELTELHTDEGWRIATRTALREVARLVPHARFPDVTLAVGGFGVGGTAGLSGLLLAAEFFVGSSGVQTRPLSAWERAALRPPRQLPFVVVHELAHALQRRAYREVTDPTLLSLSVYEGVADLLAFLATGGASARAGLRVRPRARGDAVGGVPPRHGAGGRARLAVRGRPDAWTSGRPGVLRGLSDRADRARAGRGDGARAAGRARPVRAARRERIRPRS